jgi:hypothetical protein
MMNTNQNHLFRHQSDNESNQPFAEKQIDAPQEEPCILIPDEPIIPEPPDENPNPTSPEPGVNEPEKDDPTRIDEEPPIFNSY